MSSPVIVDIVGAVVNGIKPELSPQYFHGHPVEIVGRLAQRNKGRFVNEKFPLIALFQDFNEIVDRSGTVATLNIVIANKTKPTLRAAERYEQNYIPVLYPLLAEFMRGMRLSPDVEYVEDEFTKIDRLFWGRTGLYGNEGNIFDDYVDAIELQNFIVKFKNKC